MQVFTSPTVRAALALAVLMLGTSLAGCAGGGFGTNPSGLTETNPASRSPGASAQEAVPPFDGQAAYRLVAGLATHPDGTPRFRVPGTPSHDAAALWLAAQLDQPSWSVHWQNFTGSEYRQTPKGSVDAYSKQGPDCSEADYAALPNRTFSNLYAVLPAPNATNRSLVISAHWDSQPASNMDPDADKRTLPDPAANDGASGVGVLLELVHELSGNASLRPDANLVVFLNDGEDGFYACYPLAGSIMFLNAPATRSLAGQFWLLDMVGDPNAVFVREANSLSSNSKLFDLMWAHGQRLDSTAFGTATNSVFDDHTAFIDAGIPAIDLIDMGRQPSATGGFPPQWDTTNDTMAHISASMIGTVGETVLQTLRDPAFAATWP